MLTDYKYTFKNKFLCYVQVLCDISFNDVH